MPYTPPYTCQIQRDATNQRLYIVITDATGAEVNWNDAPEAALGGKLNLSLADIRSALAAAPLVNPLEIGHAPDEIKLVEVEYTDPDTCEKWFCLMPRGGFYKKEV